MAQKPERPDSTAGGDLPDDRARRRPKKAYVAPKLVEYGSIAKLTQTSSTTKADGATLKPCL